MGAVEEEKIRNVQPSPSDGVAAGHLGKLAIDAKALGLSGPRRNGKRNEHGLYDRIAELRECRLSDVNGTHNHALWTTLRQPKEHSESAPCGWERRWTTKATGQVRLSKRYQLIEMGRAHTHIPKKTSLLDALLKKTAHQITRLWGSPVDQAAFTPHAGKLSQSNELGRRARALLYGTPNM